MTISTSKKKIEDEDFKKKNFNIKPAVSLNAKKHLTKNDIRYKNPSSLSTSSYSLVPSSLISSSNRSEIKARVPEEIK